MNCSVSILPTVSGTLAIMLALFFSACEADKSKPAPDGTAKSVEASVPDSTDTPSAPVAPRTEVKESKEAVSVKPSTGVTSPEKVAMKEGKAVEKGKEVATLGGGCFWCTEAVMERLEGVSGVLSGYMGGHLDNPTYEQVCKKNTGHIEVIEVTFDPAVITFEEILDVFWQAHDPTTLDQQGADRGPQYRSVIFYHSPEQKNIAMQSMNKLNESGVYPDPAVTEIKEEAKFWVAEGYHQDYYELNKDTNDYCRLVISPKLKKLKLE